MANLAVQYTMVVALALLFVPKLTLTLEVPPQVRSGEEVTATVWAENKSQTNLVCVIPSGPNASLGIIWKDSLKKENVSLVRDETGPFMGQWMHQEVIGTEPFLTLKPGAKAPLYQERFKVIFPNGVKPSLISEYARAKRTPLAPGEYTLSFRYGFARTFKEAKPNAKRYEFGQTLSQQARTLYNQTWTGAIDLAAKFEVKGSVGAP